MLSYALAAVGAYLLGSIPFGVIVAKALGEIDPRTSGSKNIGFTNVLRVSGKKAGILTLLGDIGKGVLAAVLAQSFGAPRPWVLFIGLSVVVGHVFSIFLRFKGGKGVATALGSVLGFEPFLGVCLFGIWIGTVISFGYSSGGALASFISFPILAYFLAGDVPLTFFSLAILGLIVYGHIENISRLLKGTETKMRLFSS
ncbi:MAG: glycerol-3-phosphate 1-O-acyltransferase PlsY [Nitrospirales bacterium]